MHPMLNIAIRAARKAGNYIARALANSDDMRSSQSTESADKRSRSIVTDVIRKSYPNHILITSGEEKLIGGKETEVQWIINPLCGMTNFIRGLPHVAISIAVSVRGKTEFACVYDPVLNDLFTARRGSGAQMNSSRIRIKSVKSLSSAVIATRASRQKPHSKFYLNIFSSLLGESAEFRQTGSVALDLCYVAAGRLDGFFGLTLDPCDMAAGDLIAREAGAIVADFAGGSNSLKSGNIVASGSRLIKPIIKHIYGGGGK